MSKSKERPKKKQSKVVTALDWTLLPVAEMRYAKKMFMYLYFYMRYFFIMLFDLIMYLISFGKFKRKDSFNFKEFSPKKEFRHLLDVKYFFSQLSDAEKAQVIQMTPKHLAQLKTSIFICYCVIIFGVVLIGKGIFAGASIMRAVMMIIMVLGITIYTWMRQAQYDGIMYSRSELIKEKNMLTEKRELLK